jgi:hypothetical protein
MRAQQRGIALSACVLATLAACGQAFTSGEPGDGGGGASSDSPGAAEGGSSGGEAGAGDASGDHHAGGDGSAHDAAAIDGPAPHDAPSIDSLADVVGTGDVVVGGAKVVFITSITFIGVLGGLDGADFKCQELASQAKLSGTFKAWLSSTTLSAAARLTHSTGPYVLVNGTQVAADWAGLTSGTLLRSIDRNEMGGAAPTSNVLCSSTNVPAAWTSTAADGTLATTVGATCADWTTSGPSNGALLGVASQTGSAWTDGCGDQTPVGTSTICAGAAALYCIEQ